MNWNTCSADVNLIMAVHFTPGRDGHAIQGIVLHHNAGNLSTEGCYQTWQTRQASAHYQVERSGRIGQLVWDQDTAWHAGNWSANLKYISIEHANSTFAPYWTISEATLDAGSHLVAALCHLYKLGRPQWNVNVFPHSAFQATSCPGAIAGAQRNEYMARAQKWYDEMTDTPAATPTPPAKPGKTIAALAQEVIAGQWGNGAARVTALTQAGYDYQAVQDEVNRILLGTVGPDTGRYTISQLADQVIRGEWGNNPIRQQRLTQAGYDYQAVQAEVNRRYS